MAERISIKDVAARAGVSPTTVSHVLNDSPGKRINEDTRARVRQAADDLGYRPSDVARSLRLQRSQLLALVSDHIATTPHAGRIILGAQEAASKRGWLLLLVNSGGDAEIEEAEIRALRQRQVDGFIYATMYHREVTLPDQLNGVPTVLLDARMADPSVASVVPDEALGGQTAAQVLIDAGHRRIGFINNVDDIPATHGRLAGFRLAMERSGLAVDDSFILAEVSVAEGGYRAGRALLSRNDRPTALFCFNDRMAMGVYQAAGELGLSIPGDLSVVGFDNQELIADGLRPGLTTIELPHHEMGVWAVDALIDRIESPDTEPAQIELPCPLVARASVDVPPD